MQPIKHLLGLLKTLLSDIRQSIVGVIVGLIAASVLGRILYLYVTARDATIATMTTPTPLWITTLLALVCCGYIYLKFRQLYLSSEPLNATPANDFTTSYLVIGKYKWKVDIYTSGHFNVDRTPFCVEHDLKCINIGGSFHCPQRDCKNIILDHAHYAIYETARSYIENKLRNNDTSSFTTR